MPKHKKEERLDAAGTAYFNEELTHLEKEILRHEYPENKGVRLFPVRNTTPATAERVKYRIINKVGNAALIASYSTDLKKVRIFGRAVFSDVRTIADAFEYSFLDIMRAAEGRGIHLPNEEAIAAREAIELEINELIFNGDSDANLNGVLTHPNIIIQTAAATGTGSSTKWADKTEEQKRADINTAINTIMVGSNGVEIPDSMALPLLQYQGLNQDLVGANQDRSLKTVVKETNDNLKNIDWANELSQVDMPSGAGTGDVAVFYEKNPSKIVVDIPLIFKRRAPQERSLVTEVPCYARYGGVVIKRPRSVLILEDI